MNVVKGVTCHVIKFRYMKLHLAAARKQNKKNNQINYVLELKSIS
jgi:hypothetical protein